MPAKKVFPHTVEPPSRAGRNVVALAARNTACSQPQQRPTPVKAKWNWLPPVPFELFDQERFPEVDCIGAWVFDPQEECFFGTEQSRGNSESRRESWSQNAQVHTVTGQMQVSVKPPEIYIEPIEGRLPTHVE